jgi:hypothetical protein
MSRTALDILIDDATHRIAQAERQNRIDSARLWLRRLQELVAKRNAARSKTEVKALEQQRGLV